MKHINIFALVMILTLFGCKNKSESVTIDDILNETTEEIQLEISEEAINEVIQSIPSPLEMATQIKESGAEFNPDIMNDTDNKDKYHTDYEKSIAMGVYAGDLGYINIYEKPHLAISYLQSLTKIGEDIGVGQFFDFETIKRLAANSDKMDSLLYLTTMNFERMDQYLRTQKRSNLSVLLVTGMWIESLHIATNVAMASKSEPVYERIAEQKMVLDQVLLIVSAYKSTAYFDDLNNQLRGLKEIYNAVTIEYIYREPETMEKDGRLVIVDKSETIVHITPELIEQIHISIGEIRNILTKNS